MRRLKNFQISEYFLTKLISERCDRIIAFEGLPDGAQFRGCAWDYSKHCFVLTYEHESFELVGEDCTIPFGLITCHVRPLEPSTK